MDGAEFTDDQRRDERAALESRRDSSGHVIQHTDEARADKSDERMEARRG